MSFKRRKGQGSDGADGASTLIKGFEVLGAFRPGEQYLGNKELAYRTGFSKATISRLTGVLMQLGYLRYSTDLGRYALGVGLLTLAHPMLSAFTIRHIARPHMQKLAEHLGGQVSMGMRAGNSIVYIESCRSRDHVLSVPEVGAVIPIISSAIGRSYLVAVSAMAQEQICAEIRLSDPAEWARHKKRVEQARAEFQDFGFTRSFGEIRPELRSCGTALRSRVDNEIVVMNCGLPTLNLKRNQLESEVGPKLVATARAIDGAYSAATLMDRLPVEARGKRRAQPTDSIEEVAA